MILPGFRRSVHDNRIHALYGMIVAQARTSVFYSDYGIPDTVQGRFELLVLHLVLVLRELEGLSYKEIAGVAGIPLGTVMSRLARARTRLRESLGAALGKES